MEFETTVGKHVTHFYGSAKERVFKRYVWTTYQIDPEKPCNEKAVAEIWRWWIGNNQWERGFVKRNRQKVAEKSNGCND